MKVILQPNTEAGYNIIFVSNGGRFPHIKAIDLPLDANVDLGDIYDTGVFVMPVNTTGRCGHSYHVYTENGQFKVNGRTEVKSAEIDDITITVEGIPKLRRL